MFLRRLDNPAHTHNNPQAAATWAPQKSIKIQGQGAESPSWISIFGFASYVSNAFRAAATANLRCGDPRDMLFAEWDRLILLLKGVVVIARKYLQWILMLIQQWISGRMHAHTDHLLQPHCHGSQCNNSSPTYPRQASSCHGALSALFIMVILYKYAILISNPSELATVLFIKQTWIPKHQVAWKLPPEKTPGTVAPLGSSNLTQKLRPKNSKPHTLARLGVFWSPSCHQPNDRRNEPTKHRNVWVCRVLEFFWASWHPYRSLVSETSKMDNMGKCKL